MGSLLLRVILKAFFTILGSLEVTCWQICHSLILSRKPEAATLEPTYKAVIFNHHLSPKPSLLAWQDNVICWMGQF